MIEELNLSWHFAFFEIVNFLLLTNKHNLLKMDEWVLIARSPHTDMLCQFKESSGFIIVLVCYNIFFSLFFEITYDNF